jgi:hypothetical protein
MGYGIPKESQKDVKICELQHDIDVLVKFINLVIKNSPDEQDVLGKILEYEGMNIEGLKLRRKRSWKT